MYKELYVKAISRNEDKAYRKIILEFKVQTAPSFSIEMSPVTVSSDMSEEVWEYISPTASDPQGEPFTI